MNRILRTLFWIVLGLTAYIFVVTVVLLYGWGFSGRTLFEWLGILIFPAVLAIGVYWLNLRQSQREREADERQRQRELEVEDQRAQDAALQAYLDQMSNLLLDRGLRHSQEDDEVRTLARARTLTVLARLDPERKSSVLRFLYETNLISKENPSIRLGGFSFLNFIAGAADLKGIDFSFSYLRNVDLSGTNLEGVNLAWCDLLGANLSETDLTKADLEGADFTDADLRFAITGDTNLDKSTLRDANLESVNFWDSSLREADLSRANLQAAKFAGSVVGEVIGESVRDADLTGADLTEANLRDAEITEEQLKQCASLKDAIMPDGSKHD